MREDRGGRMNKASSRDAEPVQDDAADGHTPVRIEGLPREAGWLLITAGVVGLVVPGMLGTPFLLAGAFVLASRNGRPKAPVALGRPFRDATDRPLS